MGHPRAREADLTATAAAGCCVSTAAHNNKLARVLWKRRGQRSRLVKWRLEPAFIMASAIDANIMKRALMQVEGVSILPLGTSECNQPARAPYPHTNSACAPATRAEAAGA